MSICDEVLALEPVARGTFLDRRCGTDHALRRDVEELLESIDNSGEFLILDQAERTD